MTDMPSLVQRSPTGVGHGRHSTVRHRSRALQKMVTSSPAGAGARYGRAGVTITGRDETIANPLDSGRTMGNGSRRRLVGEPIAGPRPKCGDGHSPVSHRMGVVRDGQCTRAPVGCSPAHHAGRLLGLEHPGSVVPGVEMGPVRVRSWPDFCRRTRPDYRCRRHRSPDAERLPSRRRSSSGAQRGARRQPSTRSSHVR